MVLSTKLVLLLSKQQVSLIEGILVLGVPIYLGVYLIKYIGNF
jgi:hypothetical protein